jgi:hypothetical protein
MNSLRKKKSLVPVASALFGTVAAFVLFPADAFARGGSRYVDVSLTGSYATNISQYYESERQIISGAIGLPFTETMGVSVGHNLKAEKNIYNDKYREALEAKGVQLPDGSVEQTRTERNYYVNATVSQWIWRFRTTLGGGAFWRTSCSEDTFQDDGCNEQDVTWNVTLGLEYVMSMRTSFKVSHQISPSEYQGSGAKNLDKVWTTGLSWSL